jgi:carboxylesterase type B
MGLLALDNGHTKGNYAFSDMIATLDWVCAHIKDFGGDPDRFTIFGQSSGAISVMAMIASPKAIGKFSAAMAQRYNIWQYSRRTVSDVCEVL